MVTDYPVHATSFGMSSFAIKNDKIVQIELQVYV